jgi:hypothetical protein
MSVSMRKTLPATRHVLRMGCGEQLLLSDSLSCGHVRHSELEPAETKLRSQPKAQRRRGE